MPSPTAQLPFDAAILDLDGVVTHTARLHAKAWKHMFDEFLRSRASAEGTEFVPFDEEDDYLPYVDGKPRYQGVKSFLASRGIELAFGSPADDPNARTVCGLGNRKNVQYLQLIDTDGVDVFDSTVERIHELRARGHPIGLVSSSKNTAQILRVSGLGDLFDARVDGVLAEETGLRGKPDPDTYLESARQLGVSPARSLVVEDAVSGIEAGRRGDFGLVIGIDRTGRADELRAAGADIVVQDMAELTVQQIDQWFQTKNT